MQRSLQVISLSSSGIQRRLVTPNPFSSTRMRIMFTDRPAAPRWLILAGAVVLALTGLSCSPATPPNASASQPLSSGGPVAEARALPAVNEGMPIVAPADTTTPPQALIEQLSVEQEQQRFVLPEGYRIEPVLAEPAIKEPAA